MVRWEKDERSSQYSVAHRSRTHSSPPRHSPTRLTFPPLSSSYRLLRFAPYAISAGVGSLR